jgi:hypothetical protein
MLLCGQLKFKFNHRPLSAKSCECVCACVPCFNYSTSSLRVVADYGRVPCLQISLRPNMTLTNELTGKEMTTQLSMQIYVLDAVSHEMSWFYRIQKH